MFDGDRQRLSVVIPVSSSFSLHVISSVCIYGDAMPGDGLGLPHHTAAAIVCIGSSYLACHLMGWALPVGDNFTDATCLQPVRNLQTYGIEYLHSLPHHC